MLKPVASLALTVGVSDVTKLKVQSAPGAVYPVSGASLPNVPAAVITAAWADRDDAARSAARSKRVMRGAFLFWLPIVNTFRGRIEDPGVVSPRRSLNPSVARR